MIIRQRDTKLVLIEQNEHGRLAGELARHWGNAVFAAPQPLDAVVIAGAQHDEGWREADAEPLFNDAEARPLHFVELPTSEHIPLYRHGVEAVAARDAYAGLLVGMHWTGLYNGRWGVQPRARSSDTAATDEGRRRDEVVRAEESRWAQVKRSLIGPDERRSQWEAQLWHNYELLQALDLLSLYVGVGPHDKPLGPADTAATELGRSLAKLDAPAGERRIPAPTRVAGQLATLVLSVGEQAGIVHVSPYPFSTDRLEVSLTGRAIPAQRYASAADARAALRVADTVKIGCTFIPAETTP